MLNKFVAAPGTSKFQLVKTKKRPISTGSNKLLSQRSVPNLSSKLIFQARETNGNKYNDLNGCTGGAISNMTSIEGHTTSQQPQPYVRFRQNVSISARKPEAQILYPNSSNQSLLHPIVVYNGNSNIPIKKVQNTIRAKSNLGRRNSKNDIKK
jgi:hypothetical protein